MSVIAEAYSFYKAGHLSEAQRLLQNHLQNIGSDAKALHLLAIVFKDQGDMEGAMRAIERARINSPSDLNILLEKAQIYRDAGNIEIALHASEVLLEKSPGQLQASLISGNYWLSQDFPERALERFDDGLKANPGHAKLAFGRIFALKDLCQQEEAWAEIRRLGAPAELLYTMGQLHMENSEPEKAIEKFRQSIAQGQNLLLAARDLLQCRFMMGGRKALDEEINALLANHSDLPDMHILVADIMIEIDDIDRALRSVNNLEARFGARFGAKGAAFRTRSLALLNSGKTEEAITAARRALEVAPGDIAAAMYLAKGLLAAGKPDEALKLAQSFETDRDQASFWLAIKATALRQSSSPDYHNLVDFDRMIGVYDLEAPSGYRTTAEFFGELKDHLSSLHEWNEQPLFQSLRLGTQTTRDLRHDGAPVMKAFFSAIDPAIRDYMAKMPDDAAHPFYGRNTKDYRISGAWSVALKSGGFHVNHIHPKGWISSSFYVDVPDSVEGHPGHEGWIKFGEPPFEAPSLKPEKYICPKPGRLVLFPSYFWHGTVPFTDGGQRITLPFDVMPL